MAEKARILVVDDAPETLELIQRNLAASGYQVFTAPGALEAIRLLDSTPVDLVVTDLKMPKVSGLDLVQHVRENLKDTEVMVITGYPTIQGAVTAVKAGSHEYLTKPFTDDELFSAVARALDTLRARRNAQGDSTPPISALGGLIGESRAMRAVSEAIRKAASTRATVLISGESGTGKELTARAIHYNGPRASAPFVPVNCGSIPESLLESELFGHVKGAFTGATESRAGFFQTADGGSIFLDEISDTSLAMQSKLLRVLQDGTIYMVGSSRSREVDVRILAATNKDLRSLVKNGVFREDLFFRLNVIAISVPPLREREDDVLLLASHFASKFANEMGRPMPRFSDEALRVLRGYSWPGNVRELENLMQRVVVMSEGEHVDVPDLPSTMRFSVDPGTGLDRTLADVEAEHIRNVLAHLGGNKTRAAEILGIDRKTLREKIKSLDAE
jgi:DNA-binding NtrC family response regulator